MSLFCWTQRKIFWRMWETEQFWGTIDFHSICFPTMEVNGAPKQPGYKLSSKYRPLCSAEQRNSYRFGTTWGWVNDRIFIFGWTIPLNKQMCKITTDHKANNEHIHEGIQVNIQSTATEINDEKRLHRCRVMAFSNLWNNVINHTMMFWTSSEICSVLSKTFVSSSNNIASSFLKW